MPADKWREAEVQKYQRYVLRLSLFYSLYTRECFYTIKYPAHYISLLQLFKKMLREIEGNHIKNVYLCDRLRKEN